MNIHSNLSNRLSRLLTYFFSITILFFFSQCSTVKHRHTGKEPAQQQEKDIVKELLFEGGEKRRLAIYMIPQEDRQDLIGYLPAMLRGEDVEEETKAFIVQLYFQYGDRMDTILSDWKQQLVWVLENSTDPSTLSLVIKYATQTRDRRFFYPITELIRHRNRDIRALSYQYLAQAKDDRAIPYILELTNTASALDKYYYLEAIEYMKDERTTIQIVSLLQHPSHAIRSAALRAIAAFHLEDAYHHILTMARKDRNYEVRKYAVQAVASLNLKRRSYILKDTIKDIHPEVRQQSTKAILSFNQSYYSRYVSQALQREPLSDLRMLMIDTMVHLGHDGGAAGLIQTLKNEKTVEVRARAAFAIGALKSKKAVPQLISSLRNDQIEDVKISVAVALGKMKEKSAVPTVLDALNNEHETFDLKMQLVTTLDQIDEPKVMPILFDLIEVERVAALKKSMKHLLRSMLYRYYKPNYKIAVREQQVSVL